MKSFTGLPNFHLDIFSYVFEHFAGENLWILFILLAVASEHVIH